MISKTQSSAINAAYQPKNSEAKATKENVVKENELSKVDVLKASIKSGDYKVDIQALSEKIAESLL